MDLNQAVTKMMQLDLKLDNKILARLRAEMKSVKGDIEDHYRSRSGLGRALWHATKRPSGKPPLLVKVGRTSKKGDTYVTGIVVTGMAALIEKGGRTKAHKIRPLTAKRLAFNVGGNAVFAKLVQHPGSTVTPTPVARPDLQRAKERIASGLQIALLELSRQVVG